MYIKTRNKAHTLAENLRFSYALKKCYRINKLCALAFIKKLTIKKIKLLSKVKIQIHLNSAHCLKRLEDILFIILNNLIQLNGLKTVLY